MKARASLDVLRVCVGPLLDERLGDVDLPSLGGFVQGRLPRLGFLAVNVHLLLLEELDDVVQLPRGHLTQELGYVLLVLVAPHCCRCVWMSVDGGVVVFSFFARAKG